MPTLPPASKANVARERLDVRTARRRRHCYFRQRLERSNDLDPIGSLLLRGHGEIRTTAAALQGRA